MSSLEEALAREFTLLEKKLNQSKVKKPSQGDFSGGKETERVSDGEKGLKLPFLYFGKMLIHSTHLNFI